MPKQRFKRLLKQKTKMAALKYLNKEKLKQSKILNIEHTKLEMEEYLLNSDRNVKVPKIPDLERPKDCSIGQT